MCVCVCRCVCVCVFVCVFVICTLGLYGRSMLILTMKSLDCCVVWKLKSKRVQLSFLQGKQVLMIFDFFTNLYFWCGAFEFYKGQHS